MNKILLLIAYLAVAIAAGVFLSRRNGHSRPIDRLPQRKIVALALFWLPVAPWWLLAWHARWFWSGMEPIGEPASKGHCLLAFVEFSDVPPGATVSLPHGLMIDGMGVTPDKLTKDWLNFEISASESHVSVTNTSSVLASVNVLCRRYRPLMRVV